MLRTIFRASVMSLLTLQTTMADTYTVSYPRVYPFIPADKAEIHNGVKRITEDPQALLNFYDIVNQGLSKHKSDVQPWGGTFWPLNKGLIADPYESSRFGYYVELGTISWTRNYNKYSRRANGVLKNVDQLNEGQLMTMAPSEKYDILLGDMGFDLTHRLWDFTQKWGNYKEDAFLTDLFVAGEDALEMAQEMVSYGWFDNLNDAFTNAYQLRGSLAVENALNLVRSGQYSNIEEAMPTAIDQAIQDSQNYVLTKKNNLIAWWEGICHGWATAATRVLRPRKTVDFELKDGRKLRFYPTDIKALVSLLWANSLIQDNYNSFEGENIGGGVLNEGLRCNLKNAKTDIWGRKYDSEPDPFTGKTDPRCIGVHPAKFHLGLVNLIGKQGRSFIVERKVEEAVDNLPVFEYEMEYFNPNNGRSYRNLNKNVERIDSDDQFRQFRHPDARYIVGVELKYTAIAWERPNRYMSDSERNDDTDEMKMYYDLELDSNGVIVGGQWRAVKVGQVSTGSRAPRNTRSRRNKGKNKQPDFFWVISNDYQNFFKNVEDLEPWTDTTKAPPESWLEAAHEAHAFHYKQKFEYGTGQKCNVVNRRTGRLRQVSCEFEVPRPQPLVNVVNKLIELSAD
ncbi:MAG: hypothetical protein CME65_10145 [Halobacteriovoraceae bacterium]|nr:hypothetical protein [Halobacteriovoraceae bacterium]